MDIGKAFTFIPKGEGWISKLAIGSVIALFSFLLLPIFFLIGYQLAVMRNVIKNVEHPLPAWENWGELFKEGGIIWVGQFIYALPLVLLSLCYQLIFLVPALGEGNTDLQNALGGIGVVVSLAWSCILFLYSIGLAFITPALFIQYVRTGEFGSLFRVGEIIEIARENLVNILLVIVAGFAAGIVLTIAVGITLITICGWIIVLVAGTVWIMISTAHLYGQIAAKDEGKLIDPAMV